MTLTCVKPPVICVINKKLIIRTIVTISAQGHVIAPVTNDTQIREAQVIKLCTGTIGAGTQVEVPLEILWTKLARTIAAAAVGEASLPCSDKALSQSCASLVLSLPSFLNRLLPVLEGHSRGLHLSHLNPRILMSRWVEPAERLLLFLGKYQRHAVESRRGSKLILQFRRGKSRLAQPTLGVFPDHLHPQHLPGSIGAVLAAAE